MEEDRWDRLYSVSRQFSTAVARADSQLLEAVVFFRLRYCMFGT